MPISSDPSRGRPSSRRLPPELIALNRQIQKRFQDLREAIHVPDSARLKQADRRSQQQRLLGEALGLQAADIAALEGNREGLPAALLLRLMLRYDLSPQYFNSLEAEPSATFQVEQKRREFEAMIEELKERGGVLPAPARPRAEAPRARAAAGRKGGWLKGLPRNPKTPEQLTVRRLWEMARDKGFIPNSLEALREWGRKEGIEGAEAIPIHPAAPEGGGRGSSRRTHSISKATRRKAQSRKGGWLKGLPRNPKTPEQLEIRRMWDEARRQNRHFSSLEALKDWWGHRHESSEAAPVPAPAPPPAPESPAPEEVREVPEAPVRKAPPAKATPQKKAAAAPRPPVEEPVPEETKAEPATPEPAKSAPEAKARAKAAPAKAKPAPAKAKAAPAKAKPEAKPKSLAKAQPRKGGGGGTPPAETVH